VSDGSKGERDVLEPPARSLSTWWAAIDLRWGAMAVLANATKHGSA
jgi:hypothetical protein